MNPPLGGGRITLIVIGSILTGLGTLVLIAAIAVATFSASMAESSGDYETNGIGLLLALGIGVVALVLLVIGVPMLIIPLATHRRQREVIPPTGTYQA
ncbi:hypothetical protein CGZ93_03940 [Enemella dayhoffiae]|uniref:Uncharacterized protein n=1 Tax=Enemella dayhoffiae TaxID=2016507 RepID=A0A255H9N0_9ACTN|nr:hypothetical protein [Enemella dayhoffiae]OYO24267.1 hypothetical protein CGZ93_03940 [Enemella dayhoffiae]